MSLRLSEELKKQTVNAENVEKFWLETLIESVNADSVKKSWSEIMSEKIVNGVPIYKKETQSRNN